MSVSKEKENQIKEIMKSMQISEDDIEEKFILGSGRGGQNLQKTSSAVFLHHLPTGIQIKCQADRSREVNRWIARRMLCEKYQEIILKEKTRKQQEREKIRRQKQTRSRKQKKKILEEKKQHSEKKALRSKTMET